MSSLSGSGQGRFYIIGNCISYYIKKHKYETEKKVLYARRESAVSFSAIRKALKKVYDKSGTERTINNDVGKRLSKIRQQFDTQYRTRQSVRSSSALAAQAGRRIGAGRLERISEGRLGWVL